MRSMLLFSLALITLSAYASDAVVTPSDPHFTQAASAVKADKHAGTKKDASKATQGESPAVGCPAGCVIMNCPPPGGPLACCKKTTSGYQAC